MLESLDFYTERNRLRTFEVRKGVKDTPALLNMMLQ